MNYGYQGGRCRGGIEVKGKEVHLVGKKDTHFLSSHLVSLWRVIWSSLYKRAMFYELRYSFNHDDNYVFSTIFLKGLDKHKHK